MKKISLFVVLAFFIGCGENPSVNNTQSTSVDKIKEVAQKVVDPCEVEYQKCSAECKISTLNQEDWKKTACETKCKTLYGACVAKEKSIEGAKYIKKKTIEGVNYIKEKTMN